MGDNPGKEIDLIKPGISVSHSTPLDHGASGNFLDTELREPEKPITTGEAIDGFVKRRFRIGVFERARILFDTKMLPGVTHQEGIDFLIKGLQLDPKEEEYYRKAFNPKTAENVRENFPDFIDLLKKQNDRTTVHDIWRAVDGDKIKKLSLQWEIEGDQLVDDAIMAHASEVEADLRKFDEFISKNKGEEIIIRWDNLYQDVDFCGWSIPGGNGLEVAKNENPHNLNRKLILRGPSAFSNKTGNSRYGPDKILAAQTLEIPFKAREALRTTEEKYWRSDGNHSFQDRPFNPNNNFNGVILSSDLDKISDSYTFNTEQDFRKILDQAVSASTTSVPKP